MAQAFESTGVVIDRVQKLNAEFVVDLPDEDGSPSRLKQNLPWQFDRRNLSIYARFIPLCQSASCPILRASIS